MEASSERSVSVIVPALNAEATIERCVSSLRNQTWPQVEVIVVDNGSHDRTAEVATRAGARVLRETVRGRSRARNRGVRDARGSFLGFMDADCAAPAEWVDTAMAALRTPWLAAAQARVQRSSAPPPSRGFVQAHYYWPFLDTCALLVSRFAFDAAGGFDEDLVRVEDMDFSLRLLACGFAFAWLPDIVVCKEHELSPWQAFGRGWVGGRSLGLLAAKWRTELAISLPRVGRDLSKAAVRALWAEARAPSGAQGGGTLEAIGRVLGTLQSGLTERGVPSTLRKAATALPARLGARRFLVIGPDETLLFDAERARLLRLSREQSFALQAFIESTGDDSEHGGRLIAELGLRPHGDRRDLASVSEP